MIPNLETCKEDWVEIDGIRFFRTGDIGQIKPDNTLQIIDRKKDITINVQASSRHLLQFSCRTFGKDLTESMWP